MKKSLRMLCIFIAMVTMVVFSSTGVFATEELETTGVTVATEETIDNNDGLETTEESEPATEPTTETTTEPATEPAPAIDVTVTAKVKAVTLTWKDLAERSEDYIVSVNPEEGQVGEISIDEKGKCTVDVTGLANYKQYTFKVECGESVGTCGIKLVPAFPYTVKAYPGYRSANLEWSKIKGVTGLVYVVERSTSKYGTYKKIAEVTNNNSARTDANLVGYEDRTFADPIANTTSVRYYRVSVKGTKAYSNPVSCNCVQPLKYNITLKETKRLTSHKGSRLTVTFKSGTRLTACGFGSGKYHFYYKGRLFYVKRISTKNQSAKYTTTLYKPKTTVYFVNQYSNRSSKTSKLIWVSYRTQHLYVFKKSNGKWITETKNGVPNGGNWKISTGKASTPSPSGTKAIGKKISRRHGIPYWSCYSSLNALHAIKSGWGKKLGRPASSGCIRNNKSQAYWIYKKCGKGTRVICY